MFRSPSKWCKRVVAGSLLALLPLAPAQAQDDAPVPYRRGAAVPRRTVRELSAAVQARLASQAQTAEAAAVGQPDNPFGDAATEPATDRPTANANPPRPIDDENQAAKQAIAARQVNPVSLSDAVSAAARIEAALDSLGAIEANETPLPDVLAEIGRTYDIRIVLDNKALEDAAIAPDVAVTHIFKDIPIRQALESMLDPLELAYVVDKHLLKVTTKEKAESQMTVRVYQLSDIAGTGDQARALVTVLQNSLPEHLVSAEGNVNIQTFGTAAVVRANYHGHRALKELLHELATAPK